MSSKQEKNRVSRRDGEEPAYSSLRSSPDSRSLMEQCFGKSSNGASDEASSNGASDEASSNGASDEASSEMRNFKGNNDSPNSSSTHSLGEDLPETEERKSRSRQSPENKQSFLKGNRLKIEHCTFNIFKSKPTGLKPIEKNRKSFETNYAVRRRSEESSGNDTCIRKPNSSRRDSQGRNRNENVFGKTHPPKRVKELRQKKSNVLQLPATNTGNRLSSSNVKDRLTASSRRKELPTTHRKDLAAATILDRDLPSTSAPTEFSSPCYEGNQRIISSKKSYPNQSISQGVSRDTQQPQQKTFVKRTKNSKQPNRKRWTRKGSGISRTQTPGLWKANEDTADTMDSSRFALFLTHVRKKKHPGEIVYKFANDFDEVIMKITGVLNCFYNRNVNRNGDNCEVRVLKALKIRLQNHKHCAKCNQLVAECD